MTRVASLVALLLAVAAGSLEKPCEDDDPVLPRVCDWRLRVLPLHVQKTGGTTLFLLCEALCPRNATEASSAEWLVGSTTRASCSFEDTTCVGSAAASIGQSSAQLARGLPCACKVFDYHLNFAEIDALGAVAPVWPIAVLRDPVDRVVSEFAYLAKHPNLLMQDQWDYLTSHALSARVRSRNMTLAQFVRTPRNPAHERQTRYLAGFGRGALNGPSKCCLRRAWAHVRKWAAEVAAGATATDVGGGVSARAELAALARADAAIARIEANASTHTLGPSGLAYPTDDGPPRVGTAECARALVHLRTRIKAIGLLEREDETRELFEYQLGWPASVRPSARASDAAARPVVSPELRAEIEARNECDVALYAEATRLFDARLARLRDKRHRAGRV